MQLLHRRKAFRATLPAGCLLRLSATLSGDVAALGTWNDQSGNGNHGALVSGATVTAGVGLNCNGSSNYCNMGSGKTQFSVTTGTICAWVKLAGYGNYTGIWSHGRSTSDIYGTMMVVHGSAGRAYVYNAGWVYATATTSITTGVWRHHAMTFDGSKVYHWINGVSEQSANVGNPAYSGTMLTSVGRYGNGTLYVVNGIIDELCVFDRVLSAPEIATVKALNAKA